MAFNVKDVLDCGGIDINFNRHHIGPISWKSKRKRAYSFVWS